MRCVFLFILLLLVQSCMVVNRAMLTYNSVEQNENTATEFGAQKLPASNVTGNTLDAGGKSFDANSAVTTSTGSATANSSEEEPKIDEENTK